MLKFCEMGDFGSWEVYAHIKVASLRRPGEVKQQICKRANNYHWFFLEPIIEKTASRRAYEFLCGTIFVVFDRSFDVIARPLTLNLFHSPACWDDAVIGKLCRSLSL